MLKNNLTGILATSGLFLLSMGPIAGCGGEEDEGDGITAADDTATGADDTGPSSQSNSNSNSNGTDTGTPGTDTGTPGTDTGGMDTSAGETASACTPDDECDEDADCPGGGTCLPACICAGGDSTGADAEPYPEPMNGACPDGYGSIDPMQVGGGVCAPPCEPEFMCPDPTSGTAMGACALVPPGASNDDCETVGEACPTDPEICLMFADGPHCSNPPMWCYLSCSGGAVCPDGQECGKLEICVWPE